MADVLQVFEMYSKKLAGDCLKLQINYDELPSFIEHSLGQAKFWQIVGKFVESLQVMLNERTKSMNKVEGEVFVRVDPSLIQITASKEEIDRRIEAFLKKKQLDVDIHNQREFCNLSNTENEYSCARVDAVFLPRVGQKNHIRVTDADREGEIMASDNITVDTMLYSQPCKRRKTSDNAEELPHGVKERLENIESHLKLSVKPVEHDVYSRIKKLEEKLLYLEGLSPEYFTYKSSSVARRLSSHSRGRSNDELSSSCSNDLDVRMLELKEKLLSEKVQMKEESFRSPNYGQS